MPTTTRASLPSERLEQTAKMTDHDQDNMGLLAVGKGSWVPFSLCTKRQNEQAEAGVPGDEPWACGITRAAKGHTAPPQSVPALPALSEPSHVLLHPTGQGQGQGRDRGRGRAGTGAGTLPAALLHGPSALTAAR